MLQVTYVCEKVSLLEHQVRHKLSRRIAQAASRKIQKQLMIFEQRRTKFIRRETKMLVRVFIIKNNNHKVNNNLLWVHGAPSPY